MKFVYLIVEVGREVVGHGQTDTITKLPTVDLWGGKKHPAFTDERKALLYLSTLDQRGYTVERIELIDASDDTPPLTNEQPTSGQERESFVVTEIKDGAIHYVDRRVTEWQPDGTVIMRDPLTSRAFTAGGVELPTGCTWMDGIKNDL